MSVSLALCAAAFSTPEARAEEPVEAVEAVEASEAGKAAVAPPTRPIVSGLLILWAYANLEAPEPASAEIYNLRLNLDKEVGPVRFYAQARYRQTAFRSFFPSNVWLHEAYVSWALPVAGLSLSAGLIGNQLGVVWDGSFFGNSHYANGLKLDADLNAELALRRDFGDLFGVSAWLQVSPAEDGINGAFATAPKLDRLVQPNDLESAPGYAQNLAVRARVVPKFTAGKLAVSPGFSTMYAEYDAVDPTTGAAGEGTRTVFGPELGLTAGPVAVFGDLAFEAVEGFGAPTADRTYLLAGGDVTLFATSEREAFTTAALGGAYARTRYEAEGFTEQIVTARATSQLHELVGAQLEWVLWQTAPDAGATVTDFDWLNLAAYVYF